MEAAAPEVTRQLSALLARAETLAEDAAFTATSLTPLLEIGGPSAEALAKEATLYELSLLAERIPRLGPFLTAYQNGGH